jgi:hypothetical protein
MRQNGDRAVKIYSEEFGKFVGDTFRISEIQVLRTYGIVRMMHSCCGEALTRLTFGKYDCCER